MAGPARRGRVGRDASFRPLWPGPLALGVPVWGWLVVLYFAAVLGLGWWCHPDFTAATWTAAVGPGLVGMVDLIRRLRTRHYLWHHPQAGEVVTAAGVLDRLTFRECGWYLPVLVLPVPLWLAGIALSVVFLREWGLW